MKKTKKKLVLAKETVRRLEGGALPQVAAGYLTEFCGPSYQVVCKRPPIG